MADLNPSGPRYRHPLPSGAPVRTIYRSLRYGAVLLLLIVSHACEVLGQRSAAADASGRGDAAAGLTVAERVHGLSLLWQEANYNFVYFDRLPDLDWDSAYRAFVPKVIEAPTTYAYYRTLQRFVGLLKDGHTNVWMPDSIRSRYPESYPWILTHNVAGHVLVRGVGRSLLERVPLGSEIVEIDGRPAREVALERHSPYVAASTEHDRVDKAVRRALYGPSDEPVRIVWVTPNRERRQATFPRDRRRREDEWVPDVNAPTPRFEIRWVEDGIAYVALNTFNEPETADEFEAALPELRGARALVIDVRENGGGSSGIGYRVAAWLTDDTLTTSAWRTRRHIGAYKAWGRWNENRREFWEMDAWLDGGTHGDVAPAKGQRVIVPTAVLIDHGTFSAAEDFLVALDPVSHITFVGRPSGGSTGQPLMFELPGGGGGRIVAKRDSYPDGRDFVGVGVQPDIIVEPTVEDVRTGRDVQLERAVEHLRARMGERR